MIDIILAFIAGVILGIIAGAIAFIYDFVMWIIKEWITIIKLAWYNVGEVYNGHIILLICNSLKEYYINCARYCSTLIKYKTKSEQEVYFNDKQDK